MALPSTSLGAEESRIEKVYRRRQSHHLYSRFNRGHLFSVQERERRFLNLLFFYGCEFLGNKTILEIGCGSGEFLRQLIQWGAKPEKLVGIDLLSDRIATAIRRCPAGVNIHRCNAASLSFRDQCFDIVLASTVFTSVLDLRMKAQMAAEMCRVLKPDGLILWYDYHMDNQKNPDVKGVASREIHELFPGCAIELSRITLAPPIARQLAPYSWVLCHILERIPWLCTHYVGVIRKKQIS